MTDAATDDLVDRVVRSLEENSARFEHERRKVQYAKFRELLLQGLIFAAGLIAGLVIH